MDINQQKNPLESVEGIEINPEEREQVLRQIEAAITESRTPSRSDLGMLQAEKSGILFPFLINLAALVLIAAGVFLLYKYFELRKESITLRRGAYMSAEGTLIHTLKQETESRLQVKEREISSIQTRLQEVEQERQILKSNLAADLQAKEQELRRQMEQELVGERERLAALGTTEAGIAERLRELESRREGTIDSQIAQYRQELEAQFQQREQELLRSSRQAREELNQANSDRGLLLVELRKQESERNAAEQRLVELNERLRAQTLLGDQAAALFQSLRENLREGRLSAVQQDLQGLESNPLVQPVLIDLLRELLRSGELRSGTQASAEELEAKLAEKDEEIAELQNQRRAIVEASASDKSQDTVVLKQLQSRVDSLSAELRSGEERVSGLSSQLRASEARVRDLRAEVQSLRAERDALAASQAALQSTQSDAFAQGRDDALRDLLTFLNFMSRSGGDSGEVEKDLLALARRDPLFQAAIREIRILIAGGGAGGQLSSPFLFLGIVSSLAQGRVVIEAMVDLDVQVGSAIQIRRITDLEREITVAEGTVQQVRGSKITASFKPVGSGGQSPAARDPVYLAAGGN